MFRWVEDAGGTKEAKQVDQSPQLQAATAKAAPPLQVQFLQTVAPLIIF